MFCALKIALITIAARQQNKRSVAVATALARRLSTLSVRPISDHETVVDNLQLFTKWRRSAVSHFWLDFWGLPMPVIQLHNVSISIILVLSTT